MKPTLKQFAQAVDKYRTLRDIYKKKVKAKSEDWYTYYVEMHRADRELGLLMSYALKEEEESQTYKHTEPLEGC